MKRFLFVFFTVQVIYMLSFSAFAQGTCGEAFSVEDLTDTQEPYSVCDYENCFIGDVNDDGRITAADARLALRFAAKLESFTEKQKLLADMDGDGRITADDARRIVRAGNVSATHEYNAVNNATMDFYIDGNGRGRVSYTVSMNRANMKTADVEICIEKKTFGIFWQKLDVKYTDTITAAYHIDTFNFNVTENGTYRAVLNVRAGKDNVELKTVCDYEKGKLNGDVNLDGRITAADARLVLRYSARLEGDSVNIRRNGDLNNDGNITAYDARLVLNIAAKI